MRINFETKHESDGSYTVTITFRDIPDQDQATAAGNLIKRALMQAGAVGSTMPLPKGKP
jgi:hypothetical protein